MSSNRSGTALTVIAVIVAIIVSSAVTYYYVSVGAPARTLTSVSTATVTSTLTLTKTLTKTKVLTEYLTKPPVTETLTSTVTVTKTVTPSAVPTGEFKSLINELVGLKLKEGIAHSIVMWLIWLSSQGGGTLQSPHLNPAAALASIITLRMTSQLVSALPPLSSEHRVNLTHTLLITRPVENLSSACQPLKVSSVNWLRSKVGEVMKPVNSSALTIQFTGGVPGKALFNGEETVVLRDGYLKVVEVMRTPLSGGVIRKVHSLLTFHDGVPLLTVLKSGKLTYYAEVNSSNGALIVRVSGGTIKVFNGFREAIKLIMKSLKVNITYCGTSELAGGITALKYEVRVSGGARVRIGNITLRINLRYEGIAYLLGGHRGHVLIFTNNTLNQLRVEVGFKGSSYCSYISKPVTVVSSVRSLK